MKKLLKRLVPLIAIVCLAGCLESSLELAPDSRLPMWLTAPDGMSRIDLRVTLDYYSTSSGGEYVFKLYKKNGFFRIKKVSFMVDAYPIVQLKQPPPGFPKGYPKYLVVSVKGVTDVIEQRKMEPIFYMTDDPNVWKELGIEKR